MKIEELRRQPHLSASAINDYMDCSLSYQFSRIDHVEPEFISDSLILGSVIHKILEVFHLSRSQGELIPLAELLQKFEEQWLEAETQQPQEIQYKEGHDTNSILQEGKELISLYYHRMPEDSLQILDTEMAFSFPLQGLPLPIVGVMDLVCLDENGLIVIVDYKTSSRAYSKSEIDQSLQLTLYHMAARKYGYEDEEILLRFDCLIKTKVPKFEQYYTVRTEEDVKRAEKKILQVWKAIESGIYIPHDTSWKCGYCCFKNHCDQWFLGGNRHE